MAYQSPFSVKLVPYEIGTSKGYKVVLKGHTAIDHETFLRDIAKGTSNQMATVRGIWDYGVELAGSRIRGGDRVDIGFGDAYMTVKGSVKNPTEPLAGNKSVHFSAVVEIAKPLQDEVKAMELKNETKTVALWIHEIVEQGHGKDDEFKLFTPNADVVINTVCGMIDAANEDEGVWLENSAKEKVATATVVTVTATYTIVKFPTLPEPGKYTLVYTCRNGEDKDEFTPATATKNVTVVAAE